VDGQVFVPSFGDGLDCMLEECLGRKALRRRRPRVAQKACPWGYEWRHEFGLDAPLGTTGDYYQLFKNCRQQTGVEHWTKLSKWCFIFFMRMMDLHRHTWLVLPCLFLQLGSCKFHQKYCACGKILHQGRLIHPTMYYPRHHAFANALCAHNTHVQGCDYALKCVSPNLQKSLRVITHDV